MKVTKHLKVLFSLLGLMALAVTLVLSAGDGELLAATIKNKAQEEVVCNFKSNVFQQWAYIFNNRTSCVYR